MLLLLVLVAPLLARAPAACDHDYDDYCYFSTTLNTITTIIITTAINKMILVILIIIVVMTASVTGFHHSAGVPGLTGA